MKKKVAIIGSTVLLLALGGVAVSNLYNLDWKIDSIFATPANKQLAWLKEPRRKSWHGFTRNTQKLIQWNLIGRLWK